MLKMSQGNSPKTSKKDKMISPGQKNSTKLLPEFIQAIDDLFVKLELTYHYQFYKVFGDDDKLLTGKKIWAKNLKKFKPSIIVQATDWLISNQDFLPTLSDLSKICSSINNDLIRKDVANEELDNFERFDKKILEKLRKKHNI